MQRPAVTLVVPFHGSRAGAAGVLESVLAVERRPGDEIVVADNTPDGTFAKVAEGTGVRVVPARAEQSAYHARNVAIAASTTEWVFLSDADCRLRPDVVDAYFRRPVPDACGALSGPIEGLPEQDALISRYARSRRHLGQEAHIRSTFRPFGVTANLLVRRAAWESIGGFQEGVRSGGDSEFCWRLWDAGWTVEFRPEAVVDHRHRETMRALVRQSARYAAGRAWLERRFPGSQPRPTVLARLVRCGAGIGVWTLTGRFERAVFKAIDAVWIVSEATAYFLDNVPPGISRAPAPERTRIALLAGDWPPLGSADPVPAGTWVEARARPLRVDNAAARAQGVVWWEDDGIARRASALARLAVRRPSAVLAAWTRRGSGAPVGALATCALRLEAAGVEEVRAFDGGLAQDAERVRRLAGLR